MRKYKGLIFDFNGVLLLDQHLHDSIWQQLGREITGRTISDAELRGSFHGRDNKGVLEHLFERDLSPEEVENHATHKELIYQQVAREEGEAYRLAPGAVELLDTLKERNIPFTIGTSSPQMNVHFFNDMLKLDRWFKMKKIACTSGAVRGKPYPDIYLKAAQNIACAPSECVVIEDAKSGVAAAHAAGIGHIIAIGPKESHQFLAELPGVSEVIESLYEVRVEDLFSN